MRIAVLALVATLLAGCVQPGEEGREVEQYSFVWFQAHYRATPPEGEEAMPGVCGYPDPPTVDAENESVVFHSPPSNVPGFRPGDLSGLVLLTTWDSTGCGIMVTEVFPAFGEDRDAEVVLRGNVSLPLRFEEDGSVTLLGPHEGEPPRGVREGEEHRGAYSGHAEDGGSFEGDYALEPHGFWPVANVRLANERAS